MLQIWAYTFFSILIVSLISLVGIATLSIKVNRLKHILLYIIAFAAGALFGDAFIHLLPDLVETTGFTVMNSMFILLGIIIFFALEKLIFWQHCHMPITKEHTHTFATMNLVGDALHNFLDGIIIGASYLISIPAGIATTIAVSLHEIPQEIGDFGVLIHGGFSKTRALLVNFATALTAFLGAALALIATKYIENVQLFLIPVAIGGFIYIAGSDLLPELHKDFTLKKSFLQLLAFIVGIAVMALLLLFE